MAFSKEALDKLSSEYLQLCRENGQKADETQVAKSLVSALIERTENLLAGSMVGSAALQPWFNSFLQGLAFHRGSYLVHNDREGTHLEPATIESIEAETQRVADSMRNLFKRNRA